MIYEANASFDVSEKGLVKIEGEIGSQPYAVVMTLIQALRAEREENAQCKMALSEWRIAFRGGVDRFSVGKRWQRLFRITDELLSREASDGTG